MRLKAEPGRLRLRYSATVELMHYIGAPAFHSKCRCPSRCLTYLYPSRYCQSDRLYDVANKEFGHLPHGYGRVLAVCDWVANHVQFKSATTNASTSALDTLTERVGVCRDFAHLMIALCRALNIPARL